MTITEHVKGRISYVHFSYILLRKLEHVFSMVLPRSSVTEIKQNELNWFFLSRIQLSYIKLIAWILFKKSFRLNSFSLLSKI